MSRIVIVIKKNKEFGRHVYSRFRYALALPNYSSLAAGQVVSYVRILMNCLTALSVKSD
jgi:hypothetical protein